MKLQDKNLIEYICSWCGHKFDKYVASFESSTMRFKGKKSRVSDQVQCPVCKNFIQTYD